MIIRSFLLAAGQLGDPAFRRALLLSMGIMAVILGVLVPAGILGGVTLMESVAVYLGTGDGWITTLLVGLGAILGILLLGAPYVLFFVALSTAAVGPFLDDVVDAVYARHYPDRPSGKSLGWFRAIAMGVEILLTGIAVLLVTLPLHLFNFVIPGVSLLIFFGVNGLVIGREYRALVITRHELSGEGGRRVAVPGFFATVLWGAVLTGLFMIPVVNLLAPLWGAAAMVHLVETKTLGEASAAQTGL
jgi:uncharacterized protein involved in cysteine biosynthesis